jgi:hypothetical protein
MVPSKTCGDPGGRSDPCIELVYLGCNEWDHLHPTATNTNNSDPLPFNFYLGVISCSVTQDTLKIKEAINLWPSPSTVQ